MEPNEIRVESARLALQLFDLNVRTNQANVKRADDIVKDAAAIEAYITSGKTPEATNGH